jgi:hypothetical protein
MKYRNILLFILLIATIPLLSHAENWNIVDSSRLWDISEKVGQAILGGVKEVGGTILVILIMFSGLRIMMSGGDQNDKKAAKGLLIFCIVLLIILLSSDAIYKLITEILKPLGIKELD